MGFILESPLLYPFLLTLIAGLSTGIGASIAFFADSKNTAFLSFALGFSAGVMLFISFTELYIASKTGYAKIYGEITGERYATALFFVGCIMALLIDKAIPEKINPHELKNDRQIQKALSAKTLALKKTGMLTALLIAVHNFPEGFATLMSAIENPVFGVAVAFAVALHNIPEGMSISLPMYYATGDRKKGFLLASASGLSEPIGALIGYFLLVPFLGEGVMAGTLALIAGMMVYVALDELIPSSMIYGNSHTTIVGLIFGMGAMAISLLLLRGYGL